MTTRCPLRIGLLVAVACAALAGCIRTPSVRYYTIPEIQEPPHAESTRLRPPWASVRVAAASVPEEIDRPELLLRLSPTEVAIDDGHRWAEPLRTTSARAVAADLGRLLHGAEVSFVDESIARDAAEVTVTIDVRRLDLELGRQVTLDAIWTVRASDGSVVRTGHSVARARAVSGSFDALALACAKVFGELSEEIARALPAVSPEDIAHKRSQGACGVAEKIHEGGCRRSGRPAGNPARRTSPATGGPCDCTDIALIRPR
jgi:uncharacterized protein